MWVNITQTETEDELCLLIAKYKMIMNNAEQSTVRSPLSLYPDPVVDHMHKCAFCELSKVLIVSYP